MLHSVKGILYAAFNLYQETRIGQKFSFISQNTSSSGLERSRSVRYTVVCYGLQWYAIVYYGVEHYGMVCCTMTWYGMVRYGTVRYSIHLAGLLPWSAAAQLEIVRSKYFRPNYRGRTHGGAPWCTVVHGAQWARCTAVHFGCAPKALCAPSSAPLWTLVTALQVQSFRTW